MLFLQGEECMGMGMVTGMVTGMGMGMGMGMVTGMGMGGIIPTTKRSLGLGVF